MKVAMLTLFLFTGISAAHAQSQQKFIKPNCAQMQEQKPIVLTWDEDDTSVRDRVSDTPSRHLTKTP